MSDLLSGLRRSFVASLLLAALLAGCSGAPRTADELHAAIDDYRQAKGDVTPERIDALFARFDSEIAEQKADAAAKPMNARADDTQRIAALEAKRGRLAQEYAAARLVRVGRAASEAAKGLGETIGRGLEDAGRRLREKMHDGSDPSDSP